MKISTKTVKASKKRKVDNSVFKKREEKKYPFDDDDDDVQEILDELRAIKVITLRKPKRLAEATKTNDPKHYPCHMIISHPIKNYYVFKDIIEDIIRRGEIRIKGALP